MSSRHLPKITQRGKTSIEIERENFEKTQTIAINKAINSQETPVKEKHVRSAILGSFHDNGGGMFWSIASKLPVQGNPIICWKFLQVLHKLLRDGHPNVTLDSLKYCSHLNDVGKLWKHLKEGYGRLISIYCKLLVQKLVFHRKNPRIPGNLNLSDDEFNKICAADVNNYFEITVDMMDYLEEILNVQQTVFGSLDMSRSNSMTNSGQCRLAPLIMCIQDSCQLYDFIVKSLFKLHSSLPPDTLSGHRDRFLVCYRRLKQFYLSSGNLQYFKNLVQVPLLPDEPPNFLIASDFSKHVKPVAIVPNQSDPEPEPEFETPEPETIGNLIDTSEPPPQNDRFDQAFGGNVNGTPEPDERDLLIERLSREIHQLRLELERMRIEDQRIMTSQREEISKLEKILSELRLSADKHLKDNEKLKDDLESAKTNKEAAEKLTEFEKQSKTNEERFKKMKDVYQKLRDEHVTLLRTHGEINKQLVTEKKTSQEKDQIIQDNKVTIGQMETERQVIQDNLQKSADEVTGQLGMVEAQKFQLEQNKMASGLDKLVEGWKRSEQLEAQVQDLEDSKSTIESELQQVSSEKSQLQSELDILKEEKNKLEQDLSQQLSDVQDEMTKVQEEKTNSEQSLSQQITDLKEKLNASESEKESLEETLTAENSELLQKLQQSQNDMVSMEQKLNKQLSDLHRKLLESCIKESQSIIEDAMDQFTNPAHTTNRCSAEFLLMRTEPVLDCVNKLKESHSKYSADKTDLDEIIQCITSFSHHVGDCVIHGIATSHSAQLDAGEELANACKEAGDKSLNVLSSIEQDKNVPESLQSALTSIQHVIDLARDLVPKIKDVKAEVIGDMVENEMESTSAAIELAAAKFEELLKKTREDNTGVELEVNERILDSCTGLMKAIKILIERSRDLQKEIVSQGRGTASDKEFYSKHHRWTEGLISAAKAVGWGATALMESADKNVKGEGKLEELIACSQEIAASTAQLVVSSKVKADRNSRCLSHVSDASKDVSKATGNVVAAVKTGAQIIEDKSLMDFSDVSLMQTKKLEMQSQVRVLELESDLEKERRKLGELRKQHYKLAGESEGWEVDEDGELIVDDPNTSETDAWQPDQWDPYSF